MSWLSDLADKAETLLNKIDQNAAAVLQEKDKKIQLSNDDILTEKNNHSINQNEMLQSSTNVDMNRVTANNSSPKNSKFKSSRKLAKIDKKSKSNPSTTIDESLINFDKNANDHLQLAQNDTTSVIEKKVMELNSPVLFQNETFNDNKDNEFENVLDVEKEMLKNEISVVNNELSLLLSKMKNAEKATDTTQSHLVEMENSYKQLLIENDKLKSTISYYETSMHNFDGTSNESHEAAIKSLQLEKNSLQERVKELDSSLLSNLSIQNKLEIELKSSQDMCLELENKLEKSRNETSNMLSEWKNYKIRVNNTLHTKEKMIEDLGGNKDHEESASINSLNSQINQLKIERNEVVKELADMQNEYSNKIKEIDHLEKRLKSADKQNSLLKEALRQEQSAKEIAEHNANSLNKDLKALHSETARQISALRLKFKEHKFSDSDKPTSETLCLSSNSLNTAESGDERVRSLTQALVAKQAVLESVTADRNNLRLQLEKTENKYRSDLINMRNNQPRIINVNDTDDVKARFPLLLEESPWDSSLSRRVKRAYSSLDTFSVRVGVFLRRNPVARIFILSYMLILHFWVLIVLCTYTPEVRNKNTIQNS